MKSLTLHLKILIAILLVIGLGSIVYQALILKIPLTENSEGQCGQLIQRSVLMFVVLSQ